MALATSPGRVVPPPRRVTRLSAAVALPAQTAAVLRIKPPLRPRADGVGDGGPAVEVSRHPAGCFGAGAGEKERGAAAGHLPSVLTRFELARRAAVKRVGKFLQARFNLRGGLRQVIGRLAGRVVPRSVNVWGSKFDRGPGDGKPLVACRDRGQAVTPPLRECS